MYPCSRLVPTQALPRRHFTNFLPRPDPPSPAPVSRRPRRPGRPLNRLADWSSRTSVPLCGSRGDRRCCSLPPSRPGKPGKKGPAPWDSRVVSPRGRLRRFVRLFLWLRSQSKKLLLNRTCENRAGYGNLQAGSQCGEVRWWWFGFVDGGSAKRHLAGKMVALEFPRLDEVVTVAVGTDERKLDGW